MESCSIYIVDDEDAVRHSLQSLLSITPNVECRTFGSGDEFLQQMHDLRPGVVILDCHMPGASGLDVLRKLAGYREQFAALILTGQGDIALAVQATKAGAVDFLEKPVDRHTLFAAIEAANAHLHHHHGAAARVATAKAKLARLSSRETDVLKGLIDGRSNKVIAHDLELSPRTVEIYRANLMEKLEVRSLSEVLRLAFAAGVVDED